MAAIIAALEAAGGDHAVLNQRAIADVDTRLAVSGRGVIEGTLIIGDRQWPINEITGAYARLMDHARDSLNTVPPLSDPSCASTPAA